MTMDQERAAHAAGIEGAPDEVVTLAEKLPAMLMTVGLGQTVAFLRGKAGAERVLDLLSGWLLGGEAPVGWEAQPAAEPRNANALQRQIAACDTAVYYQALAEALAYAGWLKRLAKASQVEGKRHHATPASP